MSLLVEKVLMVAYEVLAVVVAPQEREKTQHTPNEEAQDPEADPPRLVHSSAV